MAETVDALLDIPYKKQVALSARQRNIQRILQGVGVLIFVYQDFFKLRGQLPCQRRGDKRTVVRRFGQQMQRVMLNIREIQQARGFFLFRKPTRKLSRHFVQHQHEPPRIAQIAAALFVGAAQQLGLLFDDLAGFFTQCFDAVARGDITDLLLTGSGGSIGFERAKQRIPVAKTAQTDSVLHKSQRIGNRGGVVELQIGFCLGQG